MGVKSVVKTWWRWGGELVLSVSLLFMLPSAISFTKLLRMLFVSRPRSVEGNVVLITGASSGIGQCIAWEYAKRGARLVVVARRRNRLQEVAEECKAYGAQNAVICPADITDPQDCKRIVEFTVSTFGRLDVLVNNAGVGGASLFEDYKNASEYKRILDIDFWGHVYTTQFAVEHLQRSRGQIVVTSSMSAFLPFPFMTVYSAAKAALLNFFDTLRVELISKSITVTIASPGFIQSELTSREMPGKVPGWFPVSRTEDAAREIVETALRKERDVITPRWYSSILWFRILCPEILEWVPRVFILGQPPTRAVENVCNALLGKSGTHTLFQTLKLA